MAIPFAGNRHFYEFISDDNPYSGEVAIPFAGNRHFYNQKLVETGLDFWWQSPSRGTGISTLRKSLDYLRMVVAIPFAGNRHFYSVWQKQKDSPAEWQSPSRGTGIST